MSRKYVLTKAGSFILVAGGAFAWGRGLSEHQWKLFAVGLVFWVFGMTGLWWPHKPSV